MGDSILDGVRGYLRGQQERTEGMRAWLLSSLRDGEDTSELRQSIQGVDLQNLATIGAVARGSRQVQEVLDRVDSKEITEAEGVDELTAIAQQHLMRSFDNVLTASPADVLTYGAKVQFWQWISTLL